MGPSTWTTGAIAATRSTSSCAPGCYRPNTVSPCSAGRSSIVRALSASRARPATDRKTVSRTFRRTAVCRIISPSVRRHLIYLHPSADHCCIGGPTLATPSIAFARGCRAHDGHYYSVYSSRRCCRRQCASLRGRRRAIGVCFALLPHNCHVGARCMAFARAGHQSERIRGGPKPPEHRSHSQNRYYTNVPKANSSRRIYERQWSTGTSARPKTENTAEKNENTKMKTKAKKHKCNKNARNQNKARTTNKSKQKTQFGEVCRRFSNKKSTDKTQRSNYPTLLATVQASLRYFSFLHVSFFCFCLHWSDG